MLAGIINALLSFAGGPVIDKVLGHIEKRAANEVEKRRVEVARETTLAGYGRDVIVAGMQHRAFWIPWLMAALPLSAWFGWGVLDTLANGALPDVAVLPPQLKFYADIVWNNIFYAGAGMAGASAIASAIVRRK